MRVLLSLLVMGLLAMLPGSSYADEIEGANDPVFAQAVQTWLNGEDLTALKTLAQLSHDGNPAAQILLAEIASRGHLHTHTTYMMARKDRVALLRFPMGVSGRSWLTFAQQREPLARALLQSRQTDAQAASIAALVELGEPMAALRVGWHMLAREEAPALLNVMAGIEAGLPEQATLLLGTAHDQFQALYGPSNMMAPSNRPTLEDDVHWRLGLVAFPPTPLSLVENEASRERAMALSDDVVAWTPIRRFCEAHCADSMQTCTTVGAAALLSASPYLLSSPSERLIPNDTYWSSPRMTADLARQTENVRSWPEDSRFRQIDSCYFASMADAQKQHGHAK
ncbi:MAG: hypothetical protein AB3N23_02070 [Paracoccaceae bacterium]